MGNSQITFIGFWGIFSRPEENSATTNQVFLIEKLKQIQLVSRRKFSRNYSQCRICSFNKNGDSEYAIDGFVWPESYIHYLENHNVAIDDSFKKFIEDFDFQEQHDTVFEYSY